MPNKCFVPNCKSGYDSERSKLNGKTISLFRAPKDIDLLITWEKKIRRKDKKLSSKDCVCEHHFLPDNIMRHYEYEINGVIHKSDDKRKAPVLRQGSIPSIFPKTPKCLSLPKQKKSDRKHLLRSSTKIKKATPINNDKSAVNKSNVLKNY